MKNKQTWLPVGQLNGLQLFLAYAIPSGIASVGFHSVLPEMVSRGMSPIIGWPLVASVMLLAFTLLALYLLKREAKQNGITLKERALLKFPNARQWLIFLGILVAGIIVSLVFNQTVVPFMDLLNLTVPDYYPFWFHPEFDFSSEGKEVLSQVVLETGIASFIGLFFLTLLFNILAEDLYFRAWLLPKMGRFGKWAWVLNGLLFALYHIFQLWLMPVILVISLVMAYVVYKSRSIWPSLVMHFLVNFLGTGLQFLIILK